MSDRTPTKNANDDNDDLEGEDDFAKSPGLNVRRIAIAGGVVLTVLLAGGAYLGIQAYRTSVRVAEKRKAGLELVARNATTQSQQDAIGLLNAAVSRDPDDAEAMIAYASANLRVPRPDGEHLLEAAKAWSNVIGRAPAGHDDVRRKLVLLCEQLGQSSRVIDLVEPLRQAWPDDVDIARVHALALLRLGRNSEALAAITAWVRLDPESFEAQSLRVFAMRASNAADRDVDAYLDAQLRERPGSATLQLLKAQWLLQTARAEPALKLYQALLARAGQLSPGSDVAGRLVVTLDGIGQRRPATALLVDLVSRADADPQLRDKASTRELHLLLALRAWDAGDHPLAARLFKATEPIELRFAVSPATQPTTQSAEATPLEPPSTAPAAPRGDAVVKTIAPFPEVPADIDSEKAIDSPEAYETLATSARWHAYAALHALMMNDVAGHDAALTRIARLPPEFAEPWITALAILRGDASAAAAIAAMSSPASAGGEPRANGPAATDTEEDRIRRLHGRLDRVLARGANDALILAASADLRLRIARPDDADRALLGGSQTPAGWSIASARLVQLRRSRGQPTLALEVARLAYRRSEASVEQAIRLAQVLNDVEPRDQEQQKQFDEVVRNVQRVLPLEPNTLPMYVGLLVDQGKPDEAKQAIESALASDRVSPRTLVDLATVSQSRKLGLEQRCQDRAAQLRGGDSPDVVLSWARLEHAAGRTEAALKRLDERVAATAGSSPAEKRVWLEVRATFLAQVGAADAGKAWTELADAYGDDLNLQRRLLGLQGAVDAEAQRRAIERLKKALPDDPSWRIASARLALSSGAVPPPDAAALKQIAAEMSAIVERRPEQLDARMLLVECLRRAGNQLAAVQQLERADEATPGNPSILILTAQLVFEQGDRDRAASLLARLEKINAPLNAQQRYVAGQLYARLDRIDAAIEQLQAGRGTSREGDRLLANLLDRVGRSDEARALVDAMLLDPDAETLLLAARLAEARGDAADATRLLDRVAALPAPESRKLLLLARYHLNQGRRDVAETLLTRAVTGSSDASSGALSVDPSAPVEAQLLLAQLRIEQGRAEDAVAVVRAGAKALPHEVQLADAAAQGDRILAAARAGLPTLAVALLVEPSGRGSQALADFLARPRAASPADAASAATVRAELAELDRLAESYADAYVVQLYCADQYLQRGQPLRAASIAGRLFARNPSDPTPARLAATALARAGEWRQCASAVEGWRAKLPRGSTEPDALDAISLARQGRHDEVLAKYLDRAKSSPKSQPLDLLSGVALSLHATRRDADAVELVWAAVADEPRKIAFWIEFAADRVDPPASAAAWCDRAESGLSTQSTSAVLRAAIADARDRIADRAAAKDPALASRLRDLAEREATRIEAMSDAPAAALNAVTQRRMRRAAQLASTAAPNAAPNESSAPQPSEAVRAEWAIAERVFRAWTERSPDDWVVKNNFANLLLEAQRFAEAEPLVDAALKAAPTEPAVIDTRATLLLRQRDFAAARAEARRAVELQPLNPQWRLTLAEATWSLGDKSATLAEMDVLRWHYREREWWPADQVARYVKLDKSINPPPAPSTRRATSRPTTTP